MTGQISHGEAKRRVVHLSQFADGLWDMLFGGVVLLLSVYPVTRSVLGPGLNLFLFACLLALLVAGYNQARRVVSTPRIGVGRLRPGPLTAVTRITLFLVLVTLVIATALMGDTVRQPRLAGIPGWLNDLAVDIFFAALIVGFFSIFAHLVATPRLYLYGWLVGLGNLASTALSLYAGHTFALPLAMAGFVMLAVGLILVRRFQGRYPASTESG